MLRTTAAALLATLSVAHAQPSLPGSGVAASSPWVLLSTADTASVFVTLKSPVRDKLVSATTPDAKRATVNQMIVADGAVVSRPLPGGLLLPPGQPVALQPGGYQIQLTGLAKPLRLNDTVPLRLQFETSQPIDVTARVAATSPSNPPAAQ